MEDRPLVGGRFGRGVIVRSIDHGLGLLAAGALFGMMLLTVADVIGRDAFNAPVPGAFEITELLMVAVIFAALPSLTAADGHVTIDLIDGVMPRRFKRWHGAAVDLVSAVVLAVVAVQLWRKAVVLGSYGDTTMLLQIPIHPFIYAMACLTGVTTAILVVRLVRRFFSVPGQ